MVRKETLVVLLLWAMMAAFLVMGASAAASSRLQAVQHLAHPQGCRCCWFIWKPLIRCGKVCCGDGCCT